MMPVRRRVSHWWVLRKTQPSTVRLFRLWSHQWDLWRDQAGQSTFSVKKIQSNLVNCQYGEIFNITVIKKNFMYACAWVHVYTCRLGVDTCARWFLLIASSSGLKWVLSWSDKAISNNGTKWLGVHVLDGTGARQFVHITKIGLLFDFGSSFAGVNTLFSMGIVLSRRPFTWG